MERAIMNPKIVRKDEGTVYETGSTERFTLKITNADTNNAIDYGEAVIGHLVGPPLHIHRDQDELFHVLEGELRVQIGEETVDLGPGDVAFAPRGIPHTFVNLQPEPVRVVGVVIGSGFSRFYAEFTATVSADADPAQLAAVAAKHNIQIIGPPLLATS